MTQPTILLVEDEPSFVEALEIGLGREGFLVAVATDGIEALERFDAVDPDLVLLDVMLPRASGPRRVSADPRQVGARCRSSW